MVRYQNTKYSNNKLPTMHMKRKWCKKNNNSVLIKGIMSSLCPHKLRDVIISCVLSSSVGRWDQTRLPLTPNTGGDVPLSRGDVPAGRGPLIPGRRLRPLISPQATPYLNVTFTYRPVLCGVCPVGESEDIMLVLRGPSQGLLFLS